MRVIWGWPRVCPVCRTVWTPDGFITIGSVWNFTVLKCSTWSVMWKISTNGFREATLLRCGQTRPDGSSVWLFGLSTHSEVSLYVAQLVNTFTSAESYDAFFLCFYSGNSAWLYGRHVGGFDWRSGTLIKTTLLNLRNCGENSMYCETKTVPRGRQLGVVQTWFRAEASRFWRGASHEWCSEHVGHSLSNVLYFTVRWMWLPYLFHKTRVSVDILRRGDNSASSPCQVLHTSGIACCGFLSSLPWSA
jgi:hypothetical protein